MHSTVTCTINLPLFGRGRPFRPLDFLNQSVALSWRYSVHRLHLIRCDGMETMTYGLFAVDF
jgi:hypothetical protein